MTPADVSAYILLGTLIGVIVVGVVAGFLTLVDAWDAYTAEAVALDRVRRRRAARQTSRPLPAAVLEWAWVRGPGGRPQRVLTCRSTRRLHPVDGVAVNHPDAADQVRGGL